MQNQIVDKIIEDQILSYRYAAHEQQKVVSLLEEMKRELIAKLANEKLTGWGKARLNRLLKETTEVINDYYSRIDLPIADIYQHEVNVSVQSLAIVDGVLPAATVLNKLTTDLLILGSPLKDWWASQAQDTAFKFSAQVRQGLAQGETITDIVKRIEPIMDVSKRNARTLVHTAIQTVNNDARQAVYEANPELVNGVEWFTALDGHVCILCAARADLKWTLDGQPIGHNIPFAKPPIHPNDRCLLLPILKSLSELAGLKPGIGEVVGQRASDEGPISASTTFTQFLKGKSKSYQDDLLGKGRADLWRSGALTLRDLISQQGRPLTLDKLRAKYQ